VNRGQEQANRDQATIEGFGDEWHAFDQSELSNNELERHFAMYFRVFRWDLVSENSIGFDMGCGSGRWDKLLAPRIGHLHCIDPSAKALDVARRSLANMHNVTFHHAGVADILLPRNSMDFGVSLGVLHHVPDTFAAIRSCVEMLKPGAPLLLYLYYRFDNRPRWFRTVWALSDVIRRLVSSMPFWLRVRTTQLLAATVYWPLARLSWLLERTGVNISNLPLSSYRNNSFYAMRTDALDRFGTRLEHRFTRAEIGAMLTSAGCANIIFSPREPFWCVCATKN